jgi:hypothetical protein
MEDKTSSPVTESFAQQSTHPVPEYEAIQQTHEKTSPCETPCTFNEPSHYQGLNLPSSTSTQERQRPIYEPLRTKCTESTEQHYDNEQHSYEPLGIRSENSDYQSLHTNNRESII